MKKKYLFIIIVIFCLDCTNLEYKIVISEKQVNKTIAMKFPYDIDIIIARLTLENAEIFFNNNKIHLNLEYRGNLLEKTISGSVNAKGNLIYAKEKGAFYLSDIVIREIKINSNNIDDKSKVLFALNKILSIYFDSFPIYRLKSDNIKESLFRLFLKDIQTDQDNFIITLAVR